MSHENANEKSKALDELQALEYDASINSNEVLVVQIDDSETDIVLGIAEKCGLTEHYIDRRSGTATISFE